MHFTLPSVISFAAVGVNLVFAGLSAGIGWRGGWPEMRWFALICFTAAGYNACNAVVTLQVSSELLRVASSTSLAIAGVHGAAWLCYIAADAGRRLRRYEKVGIGGGLVLAAGAAIPGLAVSDLVRTRRLEWLGATYADALPTTFGVLVYAVCVIFLLFPLVHFARQLWRRAPMAGAFTLGLCLLFATGASDALVAAGLLNLPYLLDLGFVGLVLASGGAMVRRFVSAARELDAIKAKLEQLVADRSKQLADTLMELAQSEKLAAVGNIAAGVAHEINNPAAAVIANLAYLLDPLSRGEPLPDDARECIEESLTSTKRIGRIVRQLLDAGRVAGGHQGRCAPFAVARAVRSAVANTRTQQHQVEVSVAIDEQLFVLGDEDLFAQVMVNLIVNAAQAIAEAKPSGRIDIIGERQGERVFITVKDDGPGVPASAQSRLFEPFFTTKPQGRGTGLGLAVSLGLMRAQGGDLRLLSTSSSGTVLGVELPFAERPSEAEAAVVTAPRAAMRLLLIDDDRVVLDALTRSLGAWFKIQAVDTVEGALGFLEDPTAFDLALCDVIMPDGGGERLLAALADRRSPFTSKMLFMTAGAVTAAARAFVAEQPGRVIQKPIDPVQLLALATSVARRELPAARAAAP